jgi:uncharacterized membrane protein YfcA
MDWFFVTAASLLAGFIDAIVGGGGLVMLPSLFAAFPSAHTATLLGTNKSASIWGSGFASLQYLKRVQLRWGVLAPAMTLSFLGALAGAWLISLIAPDFLRKWLPVVLLALLLYTLARKDLGREHAPQFQGRKEIWIASGIGLLIGFYDGFFGPGTGSFFVFLFVRVLGYDFLHASASAKLLNVSSNLSAILLFAAKGHVWWTLVIPLALANILGSFLGTRLALKHGTGFVRGVFILVVGALIMRTGYDAFLR